jgi:hypothetical protein
MEIEQVQSERCPEAPLGRVYEYDFRYETPNGFEFGTCKSVVPTYDSESKSLGWYDFTRLQSEVLTIFYPQTSPGTSDSFHGLNNTVIDFEALQQYQSEACSGSLQLSVPLVFDSLNEFAPFGSLIPQWVESVSECLGPRNDAVLRHVNRRSLLMAGVEYLISRGEEERQQVSAKEHVTHFQFLTLAREHSYVKLFRSGLIELKRFCRRICRKISHLHGICSRGWQRSLLLLRVCPLSENTFVAAN